MTNKETDMRSLIGGSTIDFMAMRKNAWIGSGILCALALIFIPVSYTHLTLPTTPYV